MTPPNRTCFACSSVASEDLSIPEDCVVDVLLLPEYSSETSADKSVPVPVVAVPDEAPCLRGVENTEGENATALSPLLKWLTVPLPRDRCNVSSTSVVCRDRDTRRLLLRKWSCAFSQRQLSPLHRLRSNIVLPFDGGQDKKIRGGTPFDTVLEGHFQIHSGALHRRCRARSARRCAAFISTVVVAWCDELSDATTSAGFWRVGLEEERATRRGSLPRGARRRPTPVVLKISRAAPAASAVHHGDEDTLLLFRHFPAAKRKP